MDHAPSRFMLTSIAWNGNGWESVDTEATAGFRYTRDKPGHESFNFTFDKPNLDDRTYVYGFSAGMMKNPRRFLQPGIAFFYSKNYDRGTGHIVGVYGNARKIEEVCTRVDGFGTGELSSNIVAEREYSARFPSYLDADEYKEPDMARMVPQGGIRYIGAEMAGRIMDGAIKAANGVDDARLRRIRSLVGDERADDEARQERVAVKFRGKPSRRLSDRMHWTPVPPGEAEYAVHARRRDNENVALLKKWFDYRCQICGWSTDTKHGGRYIEAAHILPKHKGGSEIPRNILILCPNHHKVFDYGSVKITEHTDGMVKFTMNGKEHSIKLASRGAPSAAEPAGNHTPG